MKSYLDVSLNTIIRKTYFYVFEKNKFQNFLQTWWKFLTGFFVISEQKISTLPLTMLNTFFDHFRRLNFQVLKDHCVKNIQIRSFFWSAFSHIRIEYRKIRTRKNSVFGLFSRSELNDNGDDKFRSSHPEVFLGKGVLKICRKLREHSCQSAISIKLQSNWMAASISWPYISSQRRCSVKKRCSWKLRNIHRKKAMLESLFNKVAATAANSSFYLYY